MHRTLLARAAILLDVAVLASALIAAGCSNSNSGNDPASYNPYAGYSSERYADDAMWLCRPGLAADQCEINDLSATAYRADGSLELLPHQAADDPALECFYVYPTVDLSPVPGNHTDFSEIRPMLDPLLGQAAPFTRSCRMFAPLYRQVTIGTYFAGGGEELFDLAYSDVAEAFRHFLGQYDEGRPLVIMGHSQGTAMVTRLLQEEFDEVPALRDRLSVALLVGGGVTVRDGAATGGTFRNIPLCTAAEQTGCAIAFRSYAANYPPVGGSNTVGPTGIDTACTNPAALSGGRARLAVAYFPLVVRQPVFQVRDPSVETPAIDTAFLAYPELYTAECVKDDRGRSYLRVAAEPEEGDLRRDPILYTHATLDPALLGTHVLDYSFALGDLLALVEAKAAAARGR